MKLEIELQPWQVRLLHIQLKTVGKRFERYSKKTPEYDCEELGRPEDLRDEYASYARFFLDMAITVRKLIK